jgi:hypothetical protein
MIISDQRLSAFMDGELTAEEHAEIEKLLETDSELQDRLQRFQGADEIAVSMIKEIDEAPMPAAVTALLSTPENTAPSQPNPPERWRNKRPGGLFQRPVLFSKLAPIALAASLLLMIGLLVGRHSLSFVAPPLNSNIVVAEAAQTIDPDSLLFQALENGPSAIAVSDDNGASITPLLTFQTAQGSWCREIIIADGGEPQRAAPMRALACKNGSDWQLEIAMIDEAIPSSLGNYRPATSAGSSEFDAYINDKISGDPLSADAEQSLIENGWPQKPSSQ